jgi:GNAT superfamily N-acetyltransferase
MMVFISQFIATQCRVVGATLLEIGLHIMLKEIRQAVPAQDYEGLSRLMSTFRPEPFSVDELIKTDKDRQEGGFIERHVAVSDAEEIVGYGGIERAAHWKEGSFYIWVLVREDHRQQAIGSQIATLIMERAKKAGAAELVSDLKDNDTVSLHFAEKHGFTKRNYIFESVIDLSTFDLTPFETLLSEMTAQGVEIKSLSEIGSTEANQHRLYEVNFAVVKDIPGSTDEYLSWEDFQMKVIGSEWFDPETQLLAFVDGVPAGIHALRYKDDTNSMYNLVTGVLPDYRGRRIAQALKLKGILLAKERGAAYIRTQNHADNASMLAVNKKLGFKPEVGYYDVVKLLGETVADVTE